MSNNYILMTKGLVKKFPGLIALKGIDFELKRGEVHAIVGQNGAGKSTFVKVINGVYVADEGKIWIKGSEVEIKSPVDAKKYGISLIHQETMIIPNLTIAENVFISKLGFTNRLNKKELSEKAKYYLDMIGLKKDPLTKVKDLRVVEQQLVQFARALAENADIICIDELTSAMNPFETKRVFEVIRKLKEERSYSFIFITHRIDEVFEIADRVTVFREGEKIFTKNVSDTDHKEIVSAMTGRDLKDIYVYRTKRIDRSGKKPILKVIDLSTQRKTSVETELKNVSFEVYEGEIFAVLGLLGAGKTELGKALIGEEKIVSGKIMVNGEEIRPKNPAHALNHGIFYLPEDRKRYGVVPELRVYENIPLPVIKMFARGSVIRSISKEKNISIEWVKKLNIRPSNVDYKTKNLSGGNQQKVIIAKALESKAKILIFDEPTFGIDIATKADVRRIISELADQGYAIILLTSDIEEALSLADRIAIINNGVIVKIFENTKLTREELISYMGGVAK